MALNKMKYRLKRDKRIERAIEFLRSLRDYYQTTVMYHKDCDGICSAALLIRFLGAEYGLNVYSIYSPITKNYFVQNLQRVRTNSLILVDLACEQYEEVIDLSQRVRILLLDHHQFRNDLNSSTLVHLNTKMLTKRYYPASKLVYDLISKLKNIQNLRWIAAVGLIADKGYSAWKDFVDQVYREFEVKKADLFLIPRIIGSAISLNKTEQALELLTSINDPKKFLEGSETEELRDCHRRIERELERITSEVKPKKNILLDLTSDYNIRSLVASTLLERFPGKKVVVLQREPEVAALSLRGKGSLKLANQITKGIPNARFGGHPRASGVKFPKEYLPVVKTRVSELLDNDWVSV